MAKSSIVYLGDSLKILKTMDSATVNCCVTSPPYFGLRDYGVDGQIGNEPSPQEYINNLVAIFTEVHRVLRDDGTLWLNIGDTYTQSGKGCDYDPKMTPKMRPTRVNSGKHWGLGPKQLIGIPWSVAFALRDFGWRLRQEIIWHKPNPMPQPVKDRCTTAHERIFLFTKSPQYYYGFDEMQEPATYAGRSRGGSRKRYEQNGPSNYGLNNKKYDTRNTRSVWEIRPDVSKNKSHFATFPEELARRCIVAGCPVGGVVLDPFLGSGTTAVVALKHNRCAVGIELNPEYVKLANKRIEQALDQ